MAKVTLHATIFGEDGIKTRDYETALIPDAKNQEMQTKPCSVRYWWAIPATTVTCCNWC